MSNTRLISEIVALEQRLAQMLGRYASSRLINSGFTLRELKSLYLISSEGSTNFRKLAKALGVTPSNVTGIVERLVKQGLVSRKENPEDRRVTMLEVTDKGRALLSNLRESGVKRMSGILAKLSEKELSALAQGLAALVRAAEVERQEIKHEHD